MTTHYATLGIPPSATADEVRAAFIALSRQYHPDVASIEYHEHYAAITEAWNVLRHSKNRAAYDKTLRLLRTICDMCEGEGVVWVSNGFTRRTARKCTSCDGAGYVK
jgi:DnaJ-class molecular chaperone